MSGARKDKQYEKNRVFLRRDFAGPIPRHAGSDSPSLPASDYIGGDEVWIDRNIYAGWHMMSCLMSRFFRGSRSIICVPDYRAGIYAGTCAFMLQHLRPKWQASG